MKSDLESPTYEENKARSDRNRKLARALAFILILAYLVILPFYSFFYTTKLWPEQPIPFSHRVHVDKKMLSCVVCHTDVTFSDHAGVPPVQTCLLCHTQVINDFSPIKDLKHHYYYKEPVFWVKVTELPQYAYFSHRVHIQNQIDCSSCHGNVALMDRVKQVNQFSMGFCLDCHRVKKAPITCYTCHR